MTDSSWPAEFEAQLRQHLDFLYPDHDPGALVERIRPIFADRDLPSTDELWSEDDALLITYGDSIQRDGEAPLQTLAEFLNSRLDWAISTVHILPFCPFSSDDGFAVIDYREINPDLGDWDDVTAIGEKYKLMADLVINHVSSESEWFQNYIAGKDPGSKYFVEASATDDLSEVVRPRASPLLRPTQLADGTVKHVWCTFSHDQIDLNFKQPRRTAGTRRDRSRLYLERGVRLDATGCDWLPLERTGNHQSAPAANSRSRAVTANNPGPVYAPDTILLTETNVPNHENLSYFGNRNEAHLIYNFSLAPLLVHALLTGNSVRT